MWIIIDMNATCDCHIFHGGIITQVSLIVGEWFHYHDTRQPGNISPPKRFEGLVEGTVTPIISNGGEARYTLDMNYVFAIVRCKGNVQAAIDP